MSPATFEHIHALLIDLDGVLYVEEEPIPGAVEALQRFRGGGLKLRFVTNTTAHSRDRTLEKLARLRLPVGNDELVTPAALAVHQVLASVEVDPSAAAMIGDDIESDIGGALRAGLDAILVRTGKYREDRGRESGIQPTSVVDSIADVPRLLRG